MGVLSTITGLTKVIADTLYDALGAATTAINGHKDLTTGVHGVGADTIDSVGNRNSAISTHAALNASVHGVGASGFEDKANKGAVNGYPALNSSGELLVPGSVLHLTRDGSNIIKIEENTSLELALTLQRTAANNYEARVLESGVLNRIQTSSMKDVASGIVAQDASGNATVTGSTLLLTRDGNSLIILRERTANEAALMLKRIAAGDFYGYINGNTFNRIIATLDVNGDIPHMRPKVASANLRHSHDAQANTTSGAYVKLKTITFSNGISGTLRISFRIWVTAAITCFAFVRKNGVNIGAEQTSIAGGGAPDTKTQDINVGVLAPGDTIELWGHSNGTETESVDQFRISYDNAADTILVAGVTNS